MHPDEEREYLIIYKNVETTARDHQKALLTRTQVAVTVIARLEEIQTALKGVLGKQNPARGALSPPCRPPLSGWG